MLSSISLCVQSFDPSPSLSFSEDFAQFAQNFRWRLQARDPRGQRIALNESRLRARRLRGRHTPYSSLWDRGPSPGPRHEALLAEFADIAPRPSLSGDSASPIVIDDEVKKDVHHFILKLIHCSGHLHVTYL